MLQEIIRDQLIKTLVAHVITCPRTGLILDARTCVVLVDQDGDPAVVLSQTGWKEIVSEGIDQVLADRGYTVDQSTVKES